MPARPPRTLLFAPAPDERKVAKLPLTGADGVVLDLEDAVAASVKEQARSAARAGLERLGDRVLRTVRVNNERGLLQADVAAVVCKHLDALVVPKVEAPEELDRLAADLVDLERANGLARGSVALIPQIETARGLLQAAQIACAGDGRLLTLSAGTVDLARDLGARAGDHDRGLLHARSIVVVAARAAGLPGPIDGPVMDLELGADVLRRQARAAADLGFAGQVVIHPRQVASVNEGFDLMTPDARERLERIVAEFRRAEQAGSASIVVDGAFVDLPVFLDAERRLAADPVGTSERGGA